MLTVLGLSVAKVGGNHLREGAGLISKANFQKITWITFSPVHDTQARMSYFACLKALTADWKGVEWIFLRNIVGS